MFEQQTITIEDLRAAKDCVACGRPAAERIRPPCAHGAELDPELVVSVCATCVRLVRSATATRLLLRRPTSLVVPILVPLAAAFVLPTQGVLALRGPLVMAGVFLATWLALLVAITRIRRRSTASPFVVVAVRDLVVDLQLARPDREPEPDAGPYRAPAQRPAAPRIRRPRPPTDRVAGHFLRLAFAFTAAMLIFAWDRLYTELVVSNPQGEGCDLSVDGSHVAITTGTRRVHVRAGRRRIVITCTEDRHHPERLFQPQVSSDDTLYLDIDKLAAGNGFEVSRNHGMREPVVNVRIKPQPF